MEIRQIEVKKIFLLFSIEITRERTTCIKNSNFKIEQDSEERVNKIEAIKTEILKMRNVRHAARGYQTNKRYPAKFLDTRR